MSTKRNSEHRLSMKNHAATTNGEVHAVSTKSCDEEEALEQRLRESEERFHMMFEQANVGIAFMSLAGQFQQVNGCYCEIVGYSREELLGRNFHEITHPDDRALNWALLEGLLHDNAPLSTMEKRYLRRDGSIVWASLTLSLMRDGQGEAINYMAVVQDITSRKAAERGARNEALDGLLAMAESLVQVSEDGEGLGLLGKRLADVTRHDSESEIALASAVAKLSALVLERQRLLHERAESAARELALREINSRMEEFLGVASHELRTPLTTIKANVQLALRRLGPLTQKAEQVSTDADIKVGAVYDMLIRAERQIAVLNRLVGDLIDISRIQTGKLQLQLRLEPCDLTEIVLETVQEQCKTTPNRTLIFHTANKQRIPVIADAARIMQVLTNYLTNAIKYSETDKPISVSLEVQKEGEQEVARVAVRDLGPGLSPEEQQRIWECFYQVKGIQVVNGSGVGLGLGLYVSQMIIQRHHGEVGVESSRPGGATFWFTLPLAQ